ncbi:hypothetical protein SUDANB108_02132 [Streptomyces sp. enrichment culture]
MTPTGESHSPFKRLGNLQQRLSRISFWLMQGEGHLMIPPRYADCSHEHRH